MFRQNPRGYLHHTASVDHISILERITVTRKKGTWLGHMLTPRGAGAKEVGQAHSNHRTENWGGGCPQRNVAQTKDIFLWKYILKNVLVDMYKDAKHREKKLPL